MALGQDQPRVHTCPLIRRQGPRLSSRGRKGSKTKQCNDGKREKIRKYNYLEKAYGSKEKAEAADEKSEGGNTGY